MEDVGRSLAGQVADHPVIRKNGELAGRKEHREKPVVFLVSPVPGVGGTALLPRPPGAGGAVMTVGYIRRRHGLEDVNQCSIVGDSPDGVPDTVGSGKVVQRLGSQYGSGQLVDPVLSPIRQKYRLGMGIQSQDVPGAIVLLVRPRLLVFANDVVLIIIYVNATHYANLI